MMAKKIKKDELTKLQELVSKTNNAHLQLGQLESQKHTILHQLADLQQGFFKLQQDLEKEYGKVSVNIEDGTYTKIEEDESDKKD